MSHKKIRSGGGLKSRLLQVLIVVVILFQSLLSTIVFQPKPVEAANNYSPELSGIIEPDIDTTEENGIWIDRARIFLYWSSELCDGSEEDPCDNLPSHGFHAPSEDGLNKDIEYTNDSSPCDKIVDVSRGEFDSSPSRGTLVRCDDSETPVTLKNVANAKVDGFKDGDEIYMPRFLGGIDNCGNLDTGGLNGKYKNNGTFGGSGSEFTLIRPDNDEDVKIHNFNSNGSSKFAEAKQKVRRDCQNLTTGDELSYAGEGPNGARTIYLLKDFSRPDVITAATAKVDLYNSKRGKFIKLAAYFNDSQAGRDAIETCKAGAGIGGDRTAIILRLIEKPQGTDPFVDCMWRLLEGDTDFVDAMEYAYEGNYDESLISDSEGDCGDGGIPVVSDLACWLVGWIFDALHAGFGAVIEYLAAPPDMFDQQNSTLEQSMKNLRNVANLIFVLAFLFVVFQYMTNINVVDAYFVKKFIPRLVIAVILVQASFFIVSELNYFFFDLGSSVQTIVFQGNNVGDLVVGNGAATTALALGFALGPALIGIFLAIGIILLLVLLITMIVLSIRYILIIVLAIVAPIAFAALAIPQLEGLTKKWFNMYIKLLLMYPMIMFFLAASAVVAGSLSGGGVVLQILGLIAAFLPFIILPFTFKMAGGLMGNISGKIMKAPMKGYKAYKKGEGLYESKTQSGRARAERKKAMEQNKADRARRAGTADATERMRNARNRGGLRGRLDRRRAFGDGRAPAEDMDRLTSLREEGLRRQDLEDSKARLEHSQHDVRTSAVTDQHGNLVGRDAAGNVNTDDIYSRLARGERLNVEDATGAVRTIGGNEADSEMAMNQLASYGRDAAIRTLSADNNVNQASLQRAINANSGALASKAPDIVKGAAAAFGGGMSAPALAGLSANTVDELFNNHMGDATINSSVMSAVNNLTGPDSKPLSDMSRGTAERLHHHLSGIPGVDPAIIAALAAKL